MIKFFRKIRYDLMGENKTGKYLKYAFGEIILVVIGILIALSINNWSENQKTRVEESILLKALEQDFIENKQRLNKTIRSQEKMLYYSNSFIKLISSNSSRKISQDSIIKLKVYGANSWYRAELVNSSFKTIIGSGKGSIIQSMNLKKRLIEFATDMESGFEDDFESKECLIFMNNISYKYDANLLLENEKKYFGMSIPQDSVRKSIDRLLSNKYYLGALLNKTGIESARLNYQKKLLYQTDGILLELESEIE
ncbi:MAG: hypothetical protein ACJA1H_001260 [Glaciecola sp.]|jgi:hypothetical protein